MRLSPDQCVEVWGGIECTINRVRDVYFDQLEQSGHWHREGDIALFAGLGLKKIRYPILWEHHQPDINQAINWTATSEKLAELRSFGIEVIAGLVHHGSGPAYAPINAATFAAGLAAYAEEVAQAFPWITYYTPVNEPLTTARFCGLYGVWHPHETNDACFCRILVNECMATTLAMAAIRQHNPNAKLIQTDDLGKVHSSPVLAYQAAFENQRRWLAYDLLCGRVDDQHELWDYLVSNGISIAELIYFTAHPCPPNIVGVNHYLTSERYLDEATDLYPAHTHGGNGRHRYADVEAVRVANAKPDGLERLLKDAWERYRIPIAITEVHLHCTREEQMRWLHESWQIANRLKQGGIPIIAITPWALLGSYGWDHLLTCPAGNYEPGVFDCSNGIPRPTILAAMISAFSRDLPFHHPALDNPGWWRRDTRITYGKICKDGCPECGPALAISGSGAAMLEAICRGRYLKVVNADQVRSTDQVWATVVVNEYFEGKRSGRTDLIVCLKGKLPENLHLALNLLLDEESGYWEVGSSGGLRKQKKEISSLQYF